MQDILDGIACSGFRRILVVNGHGGNIPAHGAVLEWLGRNRGCQVKWTNWWMAPQTWEKAKQIDPVASHASWLENFPWTRLPGVAMPAEQKPMMDMNRFTRLDPIAKKEVLGDGNYGGLYQRGDEDMMAMWRVAVEETRALMREGWE
jgi:creatinine amidohydrolase